MTRQEALEVLRKLDPLDEDELITLPDCEIDRYRRAIEAAYGGTCAPPVSRRASPPPAERAAQPACRPKNTRHDASAPVARPAIGLV